MNEKEEELKQTKHEIDEWRRKNVEFETLKLKWEQQKTGFRQQIDMQAHLNQQMGQNKK